MPLISVKQLSDISEAAYRGDWEALRPLLGNIADNSFGFASNACIAAMRGKQWHIVRTLIENGLDSNPLLFLAVISDDTEAVQLLLQLGADIHYSSPKGYTVLIAAFDKRQGIGASSSLLGILLDLGADVNAGVYRNKCVLMWAAEYGTLENFRLLLEKGGNVNATDHDNKTVLMYAAQNGSADHVRLLLERGAEVNVRTRSLNRTALYYARRRGDATMIELFEQAGCPE